MASRVSSFSAPSKRALSIAARALALCLAALCHSAGLAQSVSDVPAAAEIVADVTLIKTRDMDFGRIIVPRGGRIDMTATQNAICTPNNGLQVLDTCESAAFAGDAGAAFQLRISVPPNRRINLTGPGQDLRLRRMTVGAGPGLSFIRRVNRNFDFNVTDPAGAFEFFVGGRLLFRNNQAPGVYTGTFVIEVDYQ